MAKQEIAENAVPKEQLFARKKEGENFRKKYDANWERNHNLFTSNPWADIKKEAWFSSEPDYNKVAEFVEIMRSMLADNRWGIDAIPSTIPDGAAKIYLDKASNFNNLLDFLWDDTQLQFILPQVFLHMFLKGTAFVKPSFDPENITHKGIGQIALDVVDPFYMYVDPDATSVDDAAYIIQVQPSSLRNIIRRWPDKAGEIWLKGGKGGEQQMAPRGTEGLSIPAADEGKRVELWECWYHDASVMLVDEDDESYTYKAKYPNGRYTLMTSTGVVLEDKANPYDRFPYVRFVEIPMPGEFWGGCTIDKVAPIQLDINRVLRTIMDNGTWLVHGIWIVDSTSGLNSKNLSNYGPRDVVSKNPGSEVRRDSGAALPGHIFEMLQMLILAFDRVAGLPDVLRGIVPSRQPVQTTMMQQESGEVRTRERARNVEVALRELGIILLYMVREHWSDKRSIRDMKATGGFDTFNFKGKDLEGWEFDVLIRPGSTLPMDRKAAMQKALELRREGIEIPDGYILGLSDLPNVEAAMAEQQQVVEEAAPEDQELGELMAITPEQGGEVSEFPLEEELRQLSDEEIAQMAALGGPGAFP